MTRSTAEWERACHESLTRSTQRRAERATPLIPRDPRALLGVLLVAVLIVTVLVALNAAMPTT